ncbi:amidohydrolase [Peptococcus simiae]|uniref:amidohydrolase n=1 Tax=Peptococcus simiae TaxID=1643805 RepID=UPI0039811AAA
MNFFYNGTIITMVDKAPFAEVLVADDQKILYVGKEEHAKPYITPDTQWINLQGKTLLPAFIDAHSHISDTAMLLKSANLQEAHSFQEITAIIQAFIDTHPTDDLPFIIGLGYDQCQLKEGIHPDKSILDEAFPNLAVVIVHTSIHMCVANSKMLDFLGINEHTPEPEGGLIGRMANSREPNGYLEETAFNPVYELICKQLALTADDIIQAQEVYLKNGMLTIQEGSTDEPIVKVCHQAAEQGRLVCDLVAYPAQNFGRGIRSVFETYASCVNRYEHNFKIAGYKLILDGSPQARSAWLSEPYEGSDDFCSYPWLNDQEVQGYTDLAYEKNLQILAHCNGDAASEQFIKACEISAKKYPQADPRPVMIHCQTVRDDQLDRMKKIGMIASIFVDHVYYWGDTHLKNLGPVRGPHISPAKTAMRKGLSVNFHTDCPIVMPNLFQTIWTAVTRQTKKGITLGQDEQVSVWEALKALTVNAAFAYFEENEKGSLEVGKKAEFIIVSDNPLQVEKNHLRNITVLACIKQGKCLYSSREGLFDNLAK